MYLSDDFLRDIASRHDWFNYQIADFKSEQGRPIFTAFLSDPNNKPSNSTKLRVWLQAAIHGNEPAADQGAMALLGKMDANETWTAGLLEKMDIFVMPRYNPDGVHYFQRYEDVVEKRSFATRPLTQSQRVRLQHRPQPRAHQAGKATFSRRQADVLRVRFAHLH